MSVKELDRVQLMTRLAERRLTQRHAGELLGLTERQVRRLYCAFKAHGAQGLAWRSAYRERALTGSTAAGPDTSREPGCLWR